jgi:hypothetical protein
MANASSSAARFFEIVAVMGALVCVWIGMVCALRGDRQGSTFHDPFDVAPHWRLFVTTGVAVLAVGLLGLLVLAVIP